MLVASSSFSSFFAAFLVVHSQLCVSAFQCSHHCICCRQTTAVLISKMCCASFFLFCRRNVAHCKDTELLDSLLDQQMCRQWKRTEWVLNSHRSGVFVCDYVSLMFDVSFLLFVCGSVDSLPLSCSSWHPKLNIKHLWSALLLLI